MNQAFDKPDPSCSGGHSRATASGRSLFRCGSRFADPLVNEECSEEGAVVRLVVCSNSAPRWQEGVGLSPRSPGGLVPLLVSLLEARGGEWVCTIPAGDNDLEDGQVHLSDGITLHPIRMPGRILEQHYLTIGVRLMLWLFHYLFDTSQEPSFDAAFKEAWAGYEAVNQAYAGQLSKMDIGADDQLLINDYHLFLVPELLSHESGVRPGRMAYFHGLPWCEPDYYAILPPAIREQILTSLLRCDVVGFHDSRWATAFQRCCHQFLPDCQVDDHEVRHSGRSTRVAVAPFPLDTDALQRMATDSKTADWRKRISALSGGRRVLARADRLDLWKNHLRGFAAYRSLLQSNPRLVEDWMFCAVTTTPSRTTERSREHQRRCEALVAEINERFGTADRPAVSLVYPDASSSRQCVTAALSEADVTLVNPTIDGMNLVAKEALFLAPRAPLLLSVNAGAYEQLAPHVAPVQPYDIEGTADALDAAMAHAGGEGLDMSGPPAQVTALLAGAGPTGWLTQLMEGHG
jgi:trehalose 6-phosphate synthase